jgi:hypothetical protein
MTSDAIGVNVQPAPRPMTNNGGMTAPQPLPTSATAVIQTIPPPNAVRPAIRMYLPPSRTDSTPAGPALTTDPTARGSIRSPALTALNPSTDCR